MHEKETIKLALFPVAGFGTRFLPATKSTPKEMLPVVDKPLIQYAVEEAYDAGIRTMIFITGRNKWSITEHFDIAYELETELKLRGKKEFIDTVNKIKPKDMHVIFIRQELALGLGHAVLCAEPIVRHQPFAVLLADDLLHNGDDIGVMAQMVALYEKHQQGIIGVQQVPKEHVNRYGIISESSKIDAHTSIIKSIIEKPNPEKAPSNLAVIGRYILPGKIMQLLKHTQKGAGGEIQLTDAIEALLCEKTLLAYRFIGTRYDCGDKFGYLQANIEIGLQHPLIGEQLKNHLKTIIN